MTLRLPWSFALLAAIAVVGCGQVGSEETGPADTVSVSGAEARDRVFDLLAQRAELGSLAVPVPSLAGVLPGNTYDVGGEQQSVSDAVVLGAVAEVLPGGAASLRGGSDSPAPFGDDAASIHYANVTLDVTETLCSTQDVGPTLTFRLYFTDPADLPVVEEGLRSMARVVVFVKDASLPNNEFLLAAPGVLLSQVEADGELPFPAVAQTLGVDWLKGKNAVQDLRQSCPR